MILESIVIIGFAILLDLVFGDPKNRYHPTAWIGMLIGTITTRMKNENYTVEKVGGIFIVLIPVCISVIILSGLNFSIDLISVESLSILISIISGIVLFKMTIAIKGMELHALAVLDSIQKNDLTQARTNLSMIVKRNTKNLDKNHILSETFDRGEWRRIADRDVSFLFYLNSEFGGGELEFPELGLTIKPKKGMMIAFPSYKEYVQAVNRSDAIETAKARNPKARVISTNVIFT